MWLYRILFAFDTLVVLVLGYLFVDGLKYSGLGESLAIWGPIIAVPVAVLVVAHVLRKRGKHWLASLLLIVLAVPPAIFAAFMGLLLASNPSWQ